MNQLPFNKFTEHLGPMITKESQGWGNKTPNKRHVNTAVKLKQGAMYWKLFALKNFPC